LEINKTKDKKEINHQLGISLKKKTVITISLVKLLFGVQSDANFSPYN
jgi:hypothetical protein